MGSEVERFDGSGEGRWIVPPVDAGHVDVQFDFVAVGIGEVEAVGHVVVGGADERDQVALAADL